MDYFTRVRNAFVSNLRPNVEALGLTIKTGGGANHLSVLCPWCGDKSGSGSLEIHSGYLKCFQCGTGDPLFDWVAKKEGLKDINEALDMLGKRLNVERLKRPAGKPKAQLSDVELELSVDALWKGGEAEPFRKEIEKRGFSQRELLPYMLGYRNNCLLFPHVRLDGAVAPAAHVWRGPWVSGARWVWIGVSGTPPNFLWPAHIMPEPGARLYLCEGEWDCLVARVKLGLNAFTWTGGANSPLLYQALPEWAKKREWDVIYDNDVWQGPGEPWAPDEKKRAEMMVRRKNLLERVARVLEVTCEGKVRLLAVPVDPRITWGGDLRDAWGNGALPNIDACIATDWTAANPPRKKVYSRIESSGVIPPERDVEIVGRFSGAAESTVWVPESTMIDCPMSQHAFCGKCRVPTHYAGQVIQWSEDRELQSQVFGSKDPNNAIMRHVMGKPTACTQASIKHSNTGYPMLSWTISEDSQSKTPIDMPVFSREIPDVSVDMLVKGTTFLPKDGQQNVMVMADEARPVDRDPFNVALFDAPLRELCPHDAETLDKLERYLQGRYRDLAGNVTRIFGADLMHLLFDMTLHSALRFRYDGGLQRGWVDGTIIGVTRSGKSQMARRLSEHYGNMAAIRSTQAAFSAAGLLATQQRTKNGGWRSKPGLFPQSHGKALVLDEFHLMLTEYLKTSPMDLLQECRDQGTLHIQKASSVQYQAAVRLITIANPVGQGGFDSMSYPCEQLFELYGKPECISRLDFAYTITEAIATEANGVAPPDPEEPRWTSELCQALIRRAWDMQPDAITLEPDAVQLAEETVRAWGAVFSTELPLYTGTDKVRSVLRCAIAIANLCYSHPSGHPLQCLVRRCHVQLVVQVMEKLFSISGYDEFSARSSDKARMVHPLDVEWYLIRAFPDPAFTRNGLQNLLGEFNQNDVMSYLNLDIRGIQEWSFRMYACGGVARRKIADKFITMRLTKPANKLLRNIMQLADEEPDRYKERRQRISAWIDMRNNNSELQPPVAPLVPDESFGEEGTGSQAN